MANQLPIASFKTTITNAISDTATTIPIDRVTDDEGVSMDALVLTFILDKGTSVEEFITGTVDAANSQLISVTRGISVRDGQTSVTALKFDHRKKAPIEITDHPYLAMAMRQLDGTDNLGGIPKNPSSRVISDSRHLADKEYVDLIAAAAGGLSSLLVSDAGGINVNIAAGYLVSSDGVITYAGVSGQALTNNATNYIEMKPDGTVSINTSAFTAGYMPLATVVTLSNDITSITDRRGFFTSPAPERVISTDFTYGATLAAGDPVYVDSAASNKLKKALATGASTADPFIGIALDAGVDTDTKKRVQLSGLVSGLSGLTVGLQYLTDAGGLSTTPGTYKKLIGYAPTTTSLILLPGFRVEDLSGAPSGFTTALLTDIVAFFASPIRAALKYTGTAGHNLATNELVAIESDGKMYRTRPTAIPTTNQGAATTLTTTQLTDEDKVLWFDQSGSEFQKTMVALETNAAPDTIRVYNVVVDANFDAISSTNNATITPATSINHFSAEIFSTDSIAVVFDDNSNTKIAIVNQLSGSPSAGSNVTLEASSNGGAVADTSTTNTLVAFSSGGSTELRSHKVTVSGTTPTESTNAAMVSEANVVPQAAKRFTGTDYIAVAYVNTGTGKLKVVIGEYNPTTGGWTSVGTPIELESSGADTFSDCIFQVLSSTKVAISWRKTDVKCAVITRSGTTATLGNILTAVSTTQDEGLGFKMLSKYSAVISGGTSAGGKLQLIALDRDQTEFSLVGSAYTNDSQTNSGIVACGLHPERLLVVYQANSTSSFIRTIELTTNLDSAIGFVEAAVAANSTEEAIVNGYMSGFTGLTAGTTYFTGLDGQLVTSDAGSGTRTTNQGKPGNVRRALVAISSSAGLSKI